MKFVEIIRRTFDRILDSLAAMAGGLILFACLIVSYEVFMRYFLNSPTSWTLEISEYCLLWITFLGTAWLLREDGHVKVDLLSDRLKARGKDTAESAIYIIIYIFKHSLP